MDKEYFTHSGYLFCNSLYKKEGEPDETPLTLENGELAKSFYAIDKIDGANASGMKNHTTISLLNGGRVTVAVPFNELVFIKTGLRL